MVATPPPPNIVCETDYGPHRYWPPKRFHESFEAIADRNPRATALISDTSVLTYWEIEVWANALARALIKNGVTREQPVGVFTERSGMLAVSLLAIFKAGGVYVPMGADLPADRLVSMIQQSKMHCLIALEGLEPPADVLHGLRKNITSGECAPILRPEEIGPDLIARNGARLKTLGKPSDLAAILFTSGSTGRPKGVQIQHDAVLNMALGHIEAQEITAQDRVLLATAPGFILGFRELCVPLLAGAALVPASRALLDQPLKLLDLMSRHHVSVAFFTPSYLRLFNGVVPDGLRCLITAGEHPNPEDAKTYAKSVEVWNVHGATEMCGTICMMRVAPDDEGPIPSGRPFFNTSVHVLDEEGQPVRAGERGEIYVTGKGIARGYLDQPDLTAASFVHTRHGLLYRTRDLGRWTPNGYLLTLGRINDMVKISGQAVSLGEIEQALLRYPGVKHAFVVQHHGRLIAFVDGAPLPSRIEDWHAFLCKTLPSYMLPADVEILAEMPINAAGKSDRQALLAMAEALQANSNDTRGLLPQGKVEKDIAGVWEEVLDTSPIFREDNYFALGGTSLLAISISQKLQALGMTVAARAILTAPTIAALAEKIVKVPTGATSRSEQQHGIATKGQEDFWVATSLGLATADAQITRILSINGRIPAPEQWQAAWSSLIARHAALRTAFLAGADDAVLWRTLKPEGLTPGTGFYIDTCTSKYEAQRLIVARVAAPLSLTEPPLARAGVVRLGGGEMLFWFTLHHAVADGVSARILQEEMHGILLDHLLPESLCGPAIASDAEQNYLTSLQAQRDRHYWRDLLDRFARDTNNSVFSEFPTDHSRPPYPSGKSSLRLTEQIDAQTVAALIRLAQAQKVSLHTLLLSLLAVEARRRSGRSTILIGTSVSVRPAWAEAAVGYFVNLPPLILPSGDAQSLVADLRTTQTAFTEALEHAAYPSGEIYREFRQCHPQARAQARTSLFDISLTANPSRNCGDAESDFSLSPCILPGEFTAPAAGIDLAFSHEPLKDGGLELALVWNPDVYRQDTAEAWLRSFAAWARWLAEDSVRIEAPAPALLPDEIATLSQWENGPSVVRPAKRLHELIEEVAEAYPDRLAVVSDGGGQSFSALDKEANRIAQHLLSHGVSSGDVVGVLTECSITLPAAILGVWKAGAIYLPLSVELPPERLAFIIKDAGAKIVLALDGLALPATLSQIEIIRPDKSPQISTEHSKPRGSPQDPAFIIYTSGTTGEPKGVVLPHAGVVNVAYATAEATGLTEEDRIAFVATPGFDASIWEFATGLVNGMAIVPVSRALRDDPWELKRTYTARGVTIAFHTPSYLRISRTIPFVGMRVLLCGGEAPSHQDARDHHYLEFWNPYGPTETTIIVSLGKVAKDPMDAPPLTAGRPIPNTRISIRREGGTPVPPGMIGEVWLSGVGLAPGYLNKPELTAKHFVETAEGRFYRTGDWGRWTKDGQLELHGRIDTQVKLHGQRIELGEIERVLQCHPAIADAEVLMMPAVNDTKILHGFVRLHPGAAMPEESAWRAHLSTHLPQYMIPASITPVASFPLMMNGKRDQSALLAMLKAPKTQDGKAPPREGLEQRIATIWYELLGETVAREDNFFALGGNSLLAVTLAHRISQDLQCPIAPRDLFAAPSLAGFSKRVADSMRCEIAREGAVSHRSDLASEGQREFWVAEATGLDTRAFTMPLIRIVDTYPLESWRAAWAALVTRHESLRTTFALDADGTLRRAIAPLEADAAAFESCNQPDRSSAIAYIRQRQEAPFTMATAPLWRIGLVAVGENGEQLFWLALHHSVGDGQSLGVLMQELEMLLHGNALPEMTGDFSRTAAREQAYFAGPEYEEDARYWEDLLTATPKTAFDEAPLDSARSATAHAGMHRFETTIDATTAHALKALARANNTSLHAVMLSLLAVEACRRVGHSDIIIGTTVSTRETAQEARVVGYYVNMLPVPIHLKRGASFTDVLGETGARLAKTLAHARYPFARIYQNHRNQHEHARHPTRYPLFDIAVTENPTTNVRYMRHRGAEYEYWETSPGEDMVLSHEMTPDGQCLLQWHVNAAVYNRDTAEYWLKALTGWAQWLAEDSDRALVPLPKLLPPEIDQLQRWEYGALAERPALRFHEVFEQRLAERGAHPAVLTQTSIRSYAELEHDANILAQALICAGVVRGCTVGVLTGRSAALPAALLGIWKAGAIYLPLSADLPPERLAFMAEDGGLSALIALDGLVVPPELSAVTPHILRPEMLELGGIEDRPLVAGSPDDIAYILYTSGSTGRPKGARITHRAYVNLVLSAGEIYGLTPDDRSLMFASPSFDVSLSDIGLPLAFGSTLCPLPYEVLSSPTAFQDFLRTLKITLADVTPSYLRLFEGADLPSLRILVTGGEAPAKADIQTYASRLRYYNAYGPTENTISSTMALLSADTPFLSAGRPLPNTSIHICDAEGQSLPPGVIGEVWLGGRGLAQDYIGRPDLTATAFVMTREGRRYRSGDLGRWRANGELEIIGRADDQVKINGIRVELGEIEAALRAHPDVAQAVVLLEGSGIDHSLWAFILPRPNSEVPLEDAWRSYLATRIPAYMIPAAVIAIDAIPLTESGKVDKGSLKNLLRGRSCSPKETLQDELENNIAHIWKDLLGVQELQRDDNFFALGGHSLLAIALAHRLEKLLGHPVPARELFVEPTLQGFAARIRHCAAATINAAASARATEGQREFWVSEQAGLDTSGFVIPLSLIARNAESVSEAQWRNAWRRVVARHEALRTGFRSDENGILGRFIDESAPPDLEFCHYPDLAAAQNHCQARQSEPISMATLPLWRAGIVQIAEPRKTLFWMALHHAVGDGVSLGVLAEDLARILSGEALPPLRASLDLAAGREEAYLASTACQHDACYWAKMLADISAGPGDAFDEWPLDFPRPSGRTAQNIKGAHIFRASLDEATARGLRTFAHQHGASLHTLLLTILALEIFRRTARSEFLIGTAASTRETADEADLVGYFVNMLPLACRISRETTIEEALRNMQAALAEGLQHARYPFARIYQDLRRFQTTSPHPARFPVFDFAVAENPGNSDEKSEFHFEALRSDEPYRLRPNTPAQDMVLVHEGCADGGLILQWYANAALYEKETAAAWMEALVARSKLLASGNRSVQIPNLLPAEEALLKAWEYGPRIEPPTPSFPAYFEQWCAEHPHRPALVSDEQVRSYFNLNLRAEALAQHLIEHGCAPQEPIGVYTSRSTALPETVLAIWKAGGCYVPLANDLPDERLKFIIEDAGIKRLVLLDGCSLPAALAETGCVMTRPEALPLERGDQTPHRACSGPAYIIYTSGSTGVPKGVVLSHEGLNNLGVSLSRALEITAEDRVLLMASPAFDAWISDLAMAWAAGAAVVPITRGEMNDIAGMRAKLARLGVTVATMPPSYLRLFAQADFPTLRILMTVGEPPITADALHYATRLRYINGYGPTENTAAATVGAIIPGAPRLTAGKPLANITVHIRDKQGAPVPPGSVGAIWLGGRGLATGYLNRPDLTAKSFIETSSGRLYDTGDLGRWTPHGDLQILGRSDAQVKLRGQRIELGEIEHLLSAHPLVHQCVVLVGPNPDGSQTLWGFVHLEPGADEPSQEAWHAYLSAKLPSYMLPTAVIRVAEIPLTHGGKIDKGALITLTHNGGLALDGRSRTPPSTEIEQRIAQTWAEHLERSFVAREDNFFDLGGDSLRAIAAVNHLRRTFRCAITDLYEHPRLADFAAICQYHPEHLHTLIRSAKMHWQAYQETRAAYEAERAEALAPQWRAYAVRNAAYRNIAVEERRDYANTLLTGATGYLGSYTLRELLSNPQRRVTALVRAADDTAARQRLGEVLQHYFGESQRKALLETERLTVLASDLRCDRLGLTSKAYDKIAREIQAVYHCAANVKHFGHYRDFEADNVAATARLIKLAAHRGADFHFASTISAAGKAPEDEFLLFTEYDAVPDIADENYYVRSKQDAERLLVAARQYLPNASIHRVGNLVYAADGNALQRDIKENAYFRQLAAFLKLGVVPNDSHTWLCHVDVVARGLVRLAESRALTNETHHLESSRKRTLARFIAEAAPIRVTGFDSFLDRLEAALDEPDTDAALTETLENMGIYRGIAPQPRSRRLEITSARTQMLLIHLGLAWPNTPGEGRKATLAQATQLFAPTKLAAP
ncbi:amino acid adenylation domain-containing protein/thioester reductase-like protein [Rhizomicrobium palustre]|uniref:Amino acid adenylation domain-containing protein/thioester reductase-like protein n=1 Tax=Rhizomicrobium palustre TaxID=189966 RepID=A0A846MV85_9PROT|nr:non-ribosomal peptide synthetase [Rhizomicrobium palustre]NIK87139.1 amino acid adenylation domain-containing protein/thioester reductase-like protein [Rhizomicrobium palustre]